MSGPNGAPDLSAATSQELWAELASRMRCMVLVASRDARDGDPDGSVIMHYKGSQFEAIGLISVMGASIRSEVVKCLREVDDINDTHG